MRTVNCIHGIFEILAQFLFALTFEIHTRVSAIETAIDSLNDELSSLVPRVAALEVEVDISTRDFRQQHIESMYSGMSSTLRASMSFKPESER